MLAIARTHAANVAPPQNYMKLQVHPTGMLLALEAALE